jgi:hypothetical protein
MNLPVNSFVGQTLPGLLLLFLALPTSWAAGPLPVTSDYASDTPQIFVLHERGELIATSWTGRIKSIRLKTSERVVKSGVGRTIAIYVTNKRYLAYSGRRNRWYSVNRSVSERCIELRVEEHNGLALTNKRILMFNGDRWTHKRRP